MSTVTKSPTRATRAAINADAAAFSSNQSLSHVVKLIAGHADARNDVLAGVVYSAYFQALSHGNKSQLQGRENSLFEQATMYSKQANAKAAGFAQPLKAATYYAAHLDALNNIGVPGKLAEGDAVAQAEALALAYMDNVETYLADVQAMAAEKRAASKAAKGEKEVSGKGTADAATDAKIAINNAVAAAKADVAAQAAPTMADMLAAVSAALLAGALDAVAVQALKATIAEAEELAVEAQIAAMLAGAGAAEEAARVNADAELEAA